MVKKEIITLTLDVEINDFQALQRFNAKYDSPAIANDHELAAGEREHVVRAAAMVVADAFTPLKRETGLQLRSITRVE